MFIHSFITLFLSLLYLKETYLALIGSLKKKKFTLFFHRTWNMPTSTQSYPYHILG